MKTMIRAALVALLAAVAAAEHVDLKPLDDPVLAESIGLFPIPVEMRRRQITGSRSADTTEPTLSSLTKRHYGSFTCTNQQLNNYCQQFIGDEGVGSYVGCADNTCYVGCQVAGYTRTNDASQICVNYNTDENNCGSFGRSCSTSVSNATPVCNSGSCSFTCTSPYVLSNGQCINTSSDVNNCGGAGISCASRAGTGYVSGSAQCRSGSCYVSCASGYTSTNGVCSRSYTSDPANCGSSGNNCANNAGTGYLSGSAACNNGQCAVSCQSGYTVSSDGKSCSLQCKDGSVLVNGKCGRAGGCKTNADCVTLTGNANAYCTATNVGDNYCFTASTNSKGLPAGSQCGYSGNANGDDNSCATGLICINYACTSPTYNDPNNCGTAGTSCPTPANGSRTCTAGKCGISCNSGFTASGTTCVNTNTDPANCGTAGTTCPTPANGSPTCSAGKCGIACNSGFTASGSTCVNTNTDPANCGTVGTSCPTPANGSRTCSAGKCGIACNTGFTASGATCVNTSSDPKNCGTAGTVCPATGNGVTGATCVNSGCQVTCQSGYTPSSDGKSCSVTCKDGSTFNGSTCVRYSCSSNAQCNTLTSRTDSACYNGQCFTTSSNSGGLPAGSSCGNAAVSPGDDNQCASGLVCVYNTCYNPNQPTACGASQTRCPVPTNGAATCNMGTCGITCNTGYLPNAAGTACALNPSTKPKKKRAQHALELCPTGETACPIAGSASFGHFVGSADRTKEFSQSAGGFECIDTTSDLQSCGGCASMGTGVDCTRITHSASVGCSNGTCVVLSCRKGWALSLDQKQCVKGDISSKEQRAAHLRQRALKRKNMGVSH